MIEQILRRNFDYFLKVYSPIKYIERIEGKKIEYVFIEMMSNYHIYSVLQQRKSAVLKRRMNIIYKGNNDEIKELIEFVINYSDGFFSALSSLLDAVAFGYSAVQLYWDYVW